VAIEYYRGNDKKNTTAIIGQQERLQLVGGKLHPALLGTVLGVTDKHQIEGVLIEKIDTSSRPWKAGLRPGDVIVSANQFRIHNLDELKQVADPSTDLLINIQRGQEAFFVVL
jgi:serine protease Do/serine protease DegQ